jgi:hypothetical protein
LFGLIAYANRLPAEANGLSFNVSGRLFERGLLHDGTRLLSLNCVAQVEDAKRSCE